MTHRAPARNARLARRSTRFVGVVLAIGLCGGAAHAADDEALYRLKEPDARLGTHIRTDVVRSTSLPLNKTYAEMTAEQQATIRGWYEQLADDDEPPYPLEGLAPIYRTIAAGQQRLLVKGALRLDVQVDRDGVAQSVKVMESPSPEVTRFVASVLLRERYKPALCRGIPCGMDAPFLMNFETR